MINRLRRAALPADETPDIDGAHNCAYCALIYLVSVLNVNVWFRFC